MAKPAKTAKKRATAKKPGKPNKGGRPTKQTPELLDRIGRGLADGTPLTEVCRRLDEDGIKLAPRTVRDWEKDPEVAAVIAHAREEGEAAIAARLRRVANGEKAAEGQAPLSSGDVQRDKLIIDTDFKLLAKFNPKRWGDKVQMADADGNKLPDPPQFLVMPVAAKE